MLRHLPLESTAPVEIRVKTSVGGPLAILDSHYNKYVTLPDDAHWRLDILKHMYVPYMKAKTFIQEYILLVKSWIDYQQSKLTYFHMFCKNVQSGLRMEKWMMNGIII